MNCKLMIMFIYQLCVVFFVWIEKSKVAAIVRHVLIGVDRKCLRKSSHKLQDVV